MISIVVILSLILGHPAVQKSQEDLPDVNTFMQNVMENLRSDYLLQNRYTFDMRQAKLKRDKNGDLQEVESNEYEVHPSLDRELTYSRHVAKNGKRLSPKDIEKQDREHNKKLEKLAKKLEKEGIDRDVYFLQLENTERQKESRTIQEVPRIYDIAIIGRETIAGHEAIQIEFHPRPDYKPFSRETKLLTKLAGKAWFSEQDYQLIKLNVEFIDNLTFVWGLLARLHKGSSIFLQRQYVNDEIWLPAELRVEGTARVLLVKKITINTINKFSNYKKFTVESKVIRFKE